MLSAYDYAVVAVYFAFLIAVGLIFRKSNASTSDYFRSGGKVLWWMVGGTAFMTQFSAWTFTGAASKAYENGALILVVYFASMLAFLLNWMTTAQRLRRMRIVTTLEGIRQRWGKPNEQFFTWLQVPLGLLTAGIALNGLAVILSTVFNLPLEATMVGAGLIVVFVATFGGSWAAVAGDFMQMLVLMAITAVTAFLALRQVGGASGFIAKLPGHSIVWGSTSTTGLICAWVLAVVVKHGVIMNNMTDGYRYLCAKDDRHARWGALLAGGLFIVGPILWFLPPMVARIVYPDLHAVAALRSLGSKINDGAYLAIGLRTMPDGMLGLMITALFAATISYMDTGLNKNAGIFIRSFYSQIVRPAATDRELMVASKVVTVGFGLLVIFSGILFNRMTSLSLFNLMQQFTSLVTLPIAIPLFFGMFFRRTPPWSGWSTVVVCFAASLVAGNLELWLGPDAYAHVLRRVSPLASWELPDVVFMLGVFVNVVVGSVWFFGTSLWYDRQPPAFRGGVDIFFAKMETPVDFTSEIGAANDSTQFRTLGRLSLVYGSFIVLLALIPNPLVGRLCFASAGAMVALVGALLFRAAGKQR